MKGKENSAYNVGSPHGYSISELAQKISYLVGNKKFRILNENDDGWNLGRYVPDISLIIKESDHNLTVSIDEAIEKTARWNKK